MSGQPWIEPTHESERERAALRRVERMAIEIAAGRAISLPALVRDMRLKQGRARRT